MFLIQGRWIILKYAVITGATSFIGISLIKTLLNKDYYIYAIIRPNSFRKNILKNFKNVKIIESNLNELDKIKNIDNYCEAFYHIAWSSDFDNPRYNLVGQLQNIDYLLKAIDLANVLKCKAFVGVGSQAECGLVNGCITANTKSSPQTAYAIAKVISYYKGLEKCNKYGIKFCWPRLLSAYGPYDREHTLIMQLIKCGIKDEILELTDGTQIWDYIYVDDVAEALYLIAKNGVHGKKYPLGSGIGRSLRSFIYEIAETLENKNIIEGIGKKPYQDGHVMNLVADSSELLKDTGFKCRVSFTDGIKATIEYIKQKNCE